MSDKYTDMDMTDAILERPYGFSIGTKRYYLYSATLGVKMMTSRILESLDIKFTDKPYDDIMKVIKGRRDDVSRLIAHYTIKDKEGHFDETIISEIIRELNTLTKEDIAVLLYMVILDDVEKFKKHIGLDEDIKEQQRVMRLKGNKNTLTFGGKSIYGTILDTACERYGWTLDYVVWGISYTNLSMLLADSIKQIYLSDEEREKIKPNSNEDVIDANDLKNMNMILSRSWE